MTSKYGTDKLFDEYFSTIPKERLLKTRGQIDRREVYEFEEKLGKPLTEFSPDEIIDMLGTFSNSNYENKVRISMRSYDAISSRLRMFFNWYIDNVKIIKNPMNDSSLKGLAFSKLISKEDNVFTKDILERIIRELYNNFDEEYAIYREAVLLMFYEGFPESKDVVLLKEEDLDFSEKKAKVRGIWRQLSDRLFNLLVKVHYMNEMPAPKGKFIMVSCEDSYYRFPTRVSNIDKDRSVGYWATYLSRIFTVDIKGKLNYNVNARSIYLLGFYDYMVGLVGKDRVSYLINAKRNPEATKELMSMAKIYGIHDDNVTSIKKLLMQFLD